MRNNIIHFNEDALKDQLSDLVRGTVEETLNALLDAEADRIVNANRYERSEEKTATGPGLTIDIKLSRVMASEDIDAYILEVLASENRPLAKKLAVLIIEAAKQGKPVHFS